MYIGPIATDDDARVLATRKVKRAPVKYQTADQEVFDQAVGLVVPAQELAAKKLGYLSELRGEHASVVGNRAKKFRAGGFDIGGQSPANVFPPVPWHRVDDHPGKPRAIFACYRRDFLAVARHKEDEAIGRFAQLQVELSVARTFDYLDTAASRFREFGNV